MRVGDEQDLLHCARAFRVTGFTHYRDDFLEGIVTLAAPFVSKIKSDYFTVEDKLHDLVIIGSAWLNQVQEARLLRYMRPVCILPELTQALKSSYRHQGQKGVKKPRGSISPPRALTIPLDDMEERTCGNVDARVLMIALRQCCRNWKEEHILTMLAAGYTQREIATSLGQHEATASRCADKLRNRLEEVVRCSD